MHYLSLILSSLLSLLGIQEPAGTTSVTRVAGTEALLSRTLKTAGAATFHCIESASGRCHYRVFDERCQATTAAAGTLQCERRQLHVFALPAGSRQVLRDLPAGFEHCVDTRAEKQCRRD